MVRKIGKLVAILRVDVVRVVGVIGIGIVMVMVVAVWSAKGGRRKMMGARESDEERREMGLKEGGKSEDGSGIGINISIRTSMITWF